MNIDQIAAETRQQIRLLCTEAILSYVEMDWSKVDAIIKAAIENAYQAGLDDKALSVLVNWEKDRAAQASDRPA